MTRLFVAAWPDAATIERLAALPRPEATGVRWVPDQNLHITLRFLGEVDLGATSEFLAAAALPSATATLGPEVVQLGGRQVVVPVEGVDRLAAAVRSATATIGAHDPRRFRGHVTIARIKRGVPATLIGTPVGGVFAITELALVASDPRPTGAVYTTVATFPTVPTVPIGPDSGRG